MTFLLRLLKGKWLTPPSEPTETFTGKTIIVTGSNTGLGFSAALKFCLLDASKVILAVRDEQKGNTTKAAIESRTGRTNQLEVWNLDMTSYHSIQAFVSRATTLKNLDIVILNAGIHRATHQTSPYGWETDIQTNTLSTTLLAILLIPKLKQSNRKTEKPPVLSFINSGMHENVPISSEIRKAPNILEASNTAKTFNGPTQYAVSKLFTMYAANKLSTIHSSSDIVITSVCPGAVATDLARDYTSVAGKIAVFVFKNLFTRTPDVGARSIVSGVLLGEKAHGRFWQHDEIKPPGRNLVGEENEMLAEKVWENILEALGKDVAGIRELVGVQ